MELIKIEEMRVYTNGEPGPATEFTAFGKLPESAFEFYLSYHYYSYDAGDGTINNASSIGSAYYDTEKENWVTVYSKSFNEGGQPLALLDLSGLRVEGLATLGDEPVELIISHGTVFPPISIYGTKTHDLVRFPVVSLAPANIDVGEGNDTVQSSSGEDVIKGHYGDDSLSGGHHADLIFGDDGNDTLDGGMGADTLYGGWGKDEFIFLNDVNGDDSIYGREGGDRLHGQEGNDSIYGGTGDDTLVGGTGADFLNGDGVFENNVHDRDLLDYEKDIAGVTINLRSNTASGGNATGDRITGFEDLAGGFGDDALTGDNKVNFLNGRGGDDTLDGGAGADTLVGGAGNDVLYVDSAQDIITERAGGGDDRVVSSVSIDLLGRNDAYSNVENVTLMNGATIAHGANTDNIIDGNDANNLLNGRGGDDTLDGGAGADKLVGGAGNDVLYVDSAQDIITERAGGGDDRVVSSVSIDLLGRNGAYANVENVTLIGEATIAHGSSADNSLIGNDLDNLLNGRNGNDTLKGGAGVDRMTGGSGNDVYYVDNAGDVTEETANGGSDLIYSAISLDMMGRNGAYTDTERLALTGSGNINGYGTDVSNSLDGNSGANILSGRGGNDNIDGNAGDDTLSGGEDADIFIFQNGFGKDVITDFNSNQAGEKIDLSGVSSIISFDDLKASHLKQAGSDAVIDDGSSNTIILNSISINSLTADDFLF